MESPTDTTLLWEPSAAVKESTNLNHYMKWLEKERGLAFQSYDDLWLWSVTDLEDFWQTVWDYFQVEASRGYTRVLAERKMPGAVLDDALKGRIRQRIRQEISPRHVPNEIFVIEEVP